MTYFMWTYPATFTALLCAAMAVIAVGGVYLSFKIAGGGGEGGN